MNPEPQKEKRKKNKTKQNKKTKAFLPPNKSFIPLVVYVFQLSKQNSSVCTVTTFPPPHLSSIFSATKQGTVQETCCNIENKQGIEMGVLKNREKLRLEEQIPTTKDMRGT